MRDYTKINAWRLGDDLTVAIYQQTQRFPKEELYGLTSQLRRAAYSVPANIAEGASRESKKEYLHFLYIARGSLAEARYFVHLAHRLGYLPESEATVLTERSGEAFGCLHGLIRAVEKEAGYIAKLGAFVTSLLALAPCSLPLVHSSLVSSPLSLVSSL
jgi:four helix bundle protein